MRRFVRFEVGNSMSSAKSCVSSFSQDRIPVFSAPRHAAWLRFGCSQPSSRLVGLASLFVLIAGALRRPGREAPW